MAKRFLTDSVSESVSGSLSRKPSPRNFRALLLAAALVLPLLSWGQAVSLRGLVTDLAGKPLAGAAVALQKARTASGPVQALTDAQGRFHLLVAEGSLGSLPGMAPGRGRLPALTGLQFTFSLESARKVRLSILSADGRKLGEPFSSRLPAGDYGMDLRGLGASAGNCITWLVLESGGKPQAFLLPPRQPGSEAATTSTFRPLPVRGGGQTTSRAAKSAASTEATASAEITAAEADWMAVSLTGYAGVTLGIQRLVDSLPVIRLSPLTYPAKVDPAAEFTPPGRLAETEGLPGWRNAGMLKGLGAPDASVVKRTVDARLYGVIADDGKDDSQALQSAIDGAAAGSGSFNDLTLLQLPAGRIDISKQIWVDRDFLVIRGMGSDPAQPGSTRIVFRPDAETRYDKPSADGTLPGMDEMTHGDGTAKWFWPGRGMFRVQTREVHPDYQASFASAPANRKDILQGSINFHWKSGIRVSQAQPYAARAGDKVIPLDANKTEMAALKPGDLLWVGAANSRNMYLEQGVTQTEYWENMHMKSRVHYVLAVDAAAKTVTLDRPLEFDLPAKNTSDGSASILGTTYYSRVMPLKAVQGVGFENFHATHDLEGLPRLDGKGAYAGDPAEAAFNYGNVAPEYALHGIVFKWAAHCWVRGVRLHMTGSHPVVTEVAKNIEVSRNHFEGSWNKGKGGNGYLRFSRAWDCLIYGNLSRGLRHLTLQWSSSGNVVIGNDLDSDINMHGGWERFNLVENNTVAVPAGHASPNCRSNCGGADMPGEGGQDGSTWYPLWWGAGHKAGKWSGATGPRNIVFRNVLRKQLTQGGPFEDYLPYYSADGSRSQTVFQFGWDRDTQEGSHWQPLAKSGTKLADWADNEKVDFSAAPNAGVNANRNATGPSLFAKDAAALQAYMR